MPGFALKASPQNAAGTASLFYYKFYSAAFSTGGEAKRSIGVKAKRLIGGEKKEEYQCT